MSRHKEGLTKRDLKMILEIQNGSTYEAAALAVGYPLKHENDECLKTPAKRAVRKLRDAALNENRRWATKEAHPEFVLMGSGPHTKLLPATDALNKFAEIDEGHRCAYESLLDKGWIVKNGQLIKK